MCGYKGHVLGFSFWDEGEPNNDKDQEDRVEMARYYQSNGWNDNSKETRYHWICEYNIF